MTDSLIVKVRADTAGVEDSLGRLDAKLDGLQAQGRTATAPVERGLNDTAAAGRRAESAVAQLNEGFGMLAKAAGVAVLVDRLGDIGKALFTAQVNAERLIIGLQFASGGKGADELKYVAEVANRLGLEFSSAASAYMKFAAAARDTRLEGQGARQVFEAVARAAAVMGASTQETEGILLALQQMISKGTVQAEELRGQLGERLPGAFQIAARSMGVTTGELSRMLQQGEIIADEFLPRFAQQLNKELGENVEKAAQRTEASLNRMSSAWDRFVQAVAHSGVGNFVAGRMDAATEGFGAMADAMSRARVEGRGFWGQMLAGVNSVSSVRLPFVSSLEEDLTAARRELFDLNAALEKQPNNLMLKQALRDTERLVAELEKARAGVAAVGGGNFTQGSADAQAARMEAAERAKADAAAADLMQRLSGQNREFAANLQALHRQYELGGVAVEEYRRRVALLIEVQGGGRQMLADLDRQKRDAQQADRERQREAERLAKAEADALAALNRERAAYGTALARTVTSLDAEIARQRESLEEIGLTKEALSELRVRRLEERIAAEEASLATRELDEAERLAAERRIERLKELIRLERERAGKEAEIERVKAIADSARRAEEEWQRTAQSIEDALTDAMVRGFEGGKSVAKSVGDWIKNYFQTTVARSLAQSLMGAMAAGLSSGANAAGSGSSLGGVLNMGASLLGSGTGGSSVLGTALTSALSGTTLGSVLGVGAGGIMGSSALYAGAIGGGSMAAGSQAAMLASQTGVFGSAGLSATAGAAGSTGFAGAAAAVPVVGWIIAAAAVAYSIISRNRRRHRPAQQNYGYLGMADPFAAHSPNTVDPSLYNPLLEPISAGVQQYARAFGGDASGIGYGLYTSASPNNRGAQTVAIVRDASGRSVYDYNVNGPNDTMEQRLQEQLPRMILAGLQASNLSRPFQEFFDQFDATRITQDQLEAVIQIAGAAQQMAEAFRQLGGPFLQLADLSVAARAGILDLTGGLEQFVAKTGAYFQSFYSEEERQALSLASVSKTLGGVGLDVSGLRTLGDYRALVDSLDLSTETGQKQFAALMNSAGAFAFGAELLGATGLDLGELTAGAPDNAGVDLMVSAQDQTNTLLGMIERAVRESGAAIVEALATRPIALDFTANVPGTVEVTQFAGTQEWGTGA